MGDLRHPPRAFGLGDMEPQGHPTMQRIVRIVLRLLDWHVSMTAPVLPFVPPSRIRQRLAWKWLRLMAKAGLMAEPVACVVIRRENVSTAASSLRPVVPGYSFYRLVTPSEVLIADVCELPSQFVRCPRRL